MVWKEAKTFGNVSLYFWKTYITKLVLLFDSNIAMKLTTVAPRSGFLIKDGSEYHLISISFNTLLLVVCLVAPFG